STCCARCGCGSRAKGVFPRTSSFTIRRCATWWRGGHGRLTISTKFTASAQGRRPTSATRSWTRFGLSGNPIKKEPQRPPRSLRNISLRSLRSPRFLFLVDGIRLVQREGRDLRVEPVAILGDHLIGPAHDAGRRLQRASRGVLKRLARSEHWLLSDHAL